MKRLLIVGGGIAGLSAAWHVSRSSAGRVQVTVLERDDRLGGKIRTDVDGPYLLEQGPDSFLTTRPDAVRLSQELGIEGRFQQRRPRPVHTYIMRGHVLSPLPGGFSGSLPLDTAALAVSPLLSEEGKRRAMEGSVVTSVPARGDESVASVFVRRFGEEAFQVLVEPLVGGIHAGDADLLSAQATIPRRSPAPGGSTSAGGVSVAEHPDAPAPQFYTFPRGTAELVAELAGRLQGMSGVRLQPGLGAESLRRRGRELVVELSDGSSVEADAVILAVPAHEAARITEGLDRELPDLLHLIPSASTVVVHLAYRQSDVAHPLDGYGYLIPSIERSDLVACTWTSRKWEGRAPDDRVLLRLFAGRFGRRDLLGTPDADLFEMARAELAATLGIRAEPELQRLHRWSLGMPQYNVGHLERVKDIRTRTDRVPGLFLAGAAFDGVGIPQCIASGTAAGEQAAAFL